MKPDVIVLGLGGMGRAALAQLANRGRRVVGIERFAPLHTFGSSHGNSRIIRQAYFLDPRYVPLVLRAYELWRELEASTGASLMTITGGLMLGPRDSDVVDGALRSAREHALPHEVIEYGELRRRFPHMAFLPSETALYEPASGYLRPEACIHAHLARAVAAGAEARFGTKAVEWSETAEGVRVRLASGETLEAGCLVVTAGPWLAELVRDAGLALGVERQVMHWFAPAGASASEALERLPIFIVARPDGRGYGFPLVPGEGLKIAFYRSFEPADPDGVNRTVDESEVALVRRFAEGLIPGVTARYLGSKVCLYTMTPDEHFIIGKHPRHERVVLAGGFSGHGFKFCSVVGEILADLATDDQTRHDIRLFSPARFSVQASSQTPVP